MRGSWAQAIDHSHGWPRLLHGDNGSITGGIQSSCACPHSAELGTFPLKMVARKLILNHKGTIARNLQVLPKGKVRAVFRLLESDLSQ